MVISNQNIASKLKTLLWVFTVVIVSDLVLSQLSGSLGDIFKGYTAFAIPLLIGVYAYLGLPIFEFDAETEMLFFKSHFVFSTMLGKKVYINREDILGFEMDSSGIRKKLVLRFVRNGKEQEQVFSISLLSKKKIQSLSNILEGIESEIRFRKETHLFI